ncbi:hypothetical protein COU19_01190 [Candidatus Kaiserbacteria bacterium CG10_big_fil_rev_8_21_14_0_10_56_12]|uniref:Uncharacterized protein n=1 Tax=Candidatus Kaiserbacteria bacterium CG10_big_fil_rev_8_21_14_0_10_56_12 TaxID=1974611 RepID=A0A2H0UA94_9BACT|nr:MAG: hypothetical protein COU19_01190 [Candidatus Kaiserbacteria bacterium CG10_big_fil_rev_8_21_14_0_10_56_12]
MSARNPGLLSRLDVLLVSLAGLILLTGAGFATSARAVETYPAGSVAAQCLDTCPGNCVVVNANDAICETTTGGTGQSVNATPVPPNALPGQDAGGNTVTSGGSGGAAGSVTETPRGVDFTYIGGYFDDFLTVVNDILVPLLIGIAFITFLYGVYKYFILGADDEAELETGRQYVLWGIIGFVVIVSVWGIVWILLTTFSLVPGGYAPPPPVL